MALKNLAGWNGNDVNSSVVGSACGSGDNVVEPSAACGSSDNVSAGCGSACGAGDGK